MKKGFPLEYLAAGLGLFALPFLTPGPAKAAIFYQTSFADQDSWYAAAHPEKVVFTPELTLGTDEATFQDGEQTIAQRDFSQFDLAPYRQISLTVDFRALSSNGAVHEIYRAGFGLGGGPHPGFTILDFSLDSGNSPDFTRCELGVSVGLGFFNGSNNNEPVPLTVGQSLDWEAWHSLTLTGDLLTGRYDSLTVNGISEDLSGYLLPRSELDGGIWERGERIDWLMASIVDHDLFGGAADDTVMFDNLSVELQPVPIPGAILLLGSGLLGLAAGGKIRKRF